MTFSVYAVFCIVNGKFYIGKSKDPKKRWTRHKRIALQGSNECPKLYSALRKYGSDNFVHSILQEFKSEIEALQAETYYIEFFNAIEFGYNCLADVDSRIGYVTSEEVKQKQSEARKRFYETNDHYYLGKERDKETKAKIAVALTGKYVGEANPFSKLTNAQRIEIIGLYETGVYSQDNLAKMYSVCRWSIGNTIKHKERYLPK